MMEKSDMEKFDPEILRKLYTSPINSHKGQNGKLLIIAGSKLFHAPLFWTLRVASRIVDMVFYSSVAENNKIAKKEFRDGIVVPRNKIDNYINEADCVLIGPGLPRLEGQEEGDDDTKEFTEGLFKKHPSKKWVIDGGSLQAIDPQFIPHDAILTPHVKEFDKLFFNVIQNSKTVILNSFQDLSRTEIPKLIRQAQSLSDNRRQVRNDKEQVQHDNKVKNMAGKYNCTILLKGSVDIVCDKEKCVRIIGGNAGMTKGGTGDVLAGLVASLYCKNDDPFLVAASASYINKKAGDSLYHRVGPYFNASDLADEIPKVMKDLILSS